MKRYAFTDIIILTSAVMFLFNAGRTVVSYAHHPGHKTEAKVEEEDLYTIMYFFDESKDIIEEAVGKKNFSVIVSRTAKMIAKIPRVKRKKPLKNLDKIKLFRKYAGMLQKELKALQRAARKKNHKGVQKAFSIVEKRCPKCHSTFRD